MLHLLQTACHTPCLVELTACEKRVLELIIEGKSNIEIAEHLYLSLSTIKTHVRNIFGKFGVNNRVQAAVFALRNDLVSEAASCGCPSGYRLC